MIKKLRSKQIFKKVKDLLVYWNKISASLRKSALQKKIVWIPFEIDVKTTIIASFIRVIVIIQKLPLVPVLKCLRLMMRVAEENRFQRKRKIF